MPSFEVVGSTAHAIAHSARCEAIIAEPFAERIIPPARVSVFFEDSFSLKRFRRDGGETGLARVLQNRYPFYVLKGFR